MTNAKKMAMLSLVKSMQHRSTSEFGHGHILMVPIIISTILVSILLAGCASPQNLSNVYILALSYQSTPQVSARGAPATNISNSISAAVGLSNTVEVRAGYFNLCVSQQGKQWECGRDASSLQDRFLDADPLNLITLASGFRDGVIFPGFLAMQIVLHFIAFIALAAFPSWYEEPGNPKIDPFPTRSLAYIAQFAAGGAALFGLLSALWQHAAAVTAGAVVSATTYGHVVSHTGTAGVSMAWISYLLLMFSFVYILVMRIFVNRFEISIDDDGNDGLNDHYQT
ncbi:Ca2+ regulator and membrane fusion protein Fig1-domain-containing protein [Lasiosphaeria ovina]|uniref:Ca2+ regulator and membrane fusion protein Fig1-domain-containing protein n=1 Tax=Lasiosphaeria ovina TaxID=92902 RepID=A0AAE0MYQ3_9PEZI|nr:Ca2+ regulator and membrane fusion protein Fig1-domain-containing protein [Lasiosphaeria ovina]